MKRLALPERLDRHARAFNRGAHPGSRWIPDSVADWNELRRHMAEDHGIDVGPPRPFRSLLAAYELGHRHRAIHTEWGDR